MTFDEARELYSDDWSPSDDDILWYLNETYSDPYEALDEHL